MHQKLDKIVTMPLQKGKQTQQTNGKGMFKYVVFYRNDILLIVMIYFKQYSECMSTYGENCRHPCNKICINQTCDRENGTCLYGCKYGKKCDEGIHVSE